MSNPQDYAWQGAADAGTDVSDHNVLDFLVDRRLEQVRTSVPVKIMRAPYDANGNNITPGSPVQIGYVDVQVLVNQQDGYGNAIPHDTVYRLSYHRYQSGNGAFITDPVVGDMGQLVVADRDTSSVRANNGAANPGSRRKFDLADGTYVGCSQSNGGPQQYFAFTTNGFTIQDKNGCSIVTSGGMMTITAPEGVIINGATITGAGEVIDKLGVVLGTHVHSDAGGSGDSGPPVT